MTAATTPPPDRASTSYGWGIRHLGFRGAAPPGQHGHGPVTKEWGREPPGGSGGPLPRLALAGQVADHGGRGQAAPPGEGYPPPPGPPRPGPPRPPRLPARHPPAPG